jgi:hypothetical protein
MLLSSTIPRPERFLMPLAFRATRSAFWADAMKQSSALDQTRLSETSACFEAACWP